MEWFRNISGFPDYNVSNYGRVVNIVTLRSAFVQKTKDGYLVPQLHNRKGQASPIHILVAEAFLGGVPKNRKVVHIDGDTTNNFLENLELRDISSDELGTDPTRYYTFVNQPRKIRDKTSRPANNSIAIRIVATGREFPSMLHAAKALGISVHSIANHIHGRRPDAQGYKLEKVEDNK